MSDEITTEEATPTPKPTDTEQPKTEPAVVPEKGDKDWQAEAEKWKTFARKHEDAAKANADKAKRFEEFEESQKTEMQKAADRAEAAEAKVVEIEARATRAEVAAAKGVPGDLLSGSTKEELEASADALIAFRGEKPKPDFGGGDRGADIAGKKQVASLADLNSMSPEEINEARRDGRLADLLRK